MSHAAIAAIAIGYVVIAVIGAAIAHETDEYNNDIEGAIIVGIAWPLIITVAIIGAPLCGLFIATTRLIRRIRAWRSERHIPKATAKEPSP